MRPGLHAHVIPEKDDVYVRTDRRQIGLKVAQMDLHETIQETLDSIGVLGHEQEEIVDSAQELGDFHYIAILSKAV